MTRSKKASAFFENKAARWSLLRTHRAVLFFLVKPTAPFVVPMYPYHPRLLAKSNIEKQNTSHRVNDVCNGSPSRILRVLRISFGMTILPKSSTRRTMPVAFISSSPLKRKSAGFSGRSICRKRGIMYDGGRGALHIE